MKQILTGTFPDTDSARFVVRRLEDLGFDHADISIVTPSAPDGEDKVDGTAKKGAGAGAVIGGASGLLAALTSVVIPGVGPVLAAGWLASTIGGAIAGGAVGGTAGELVGQLTDHEQPQADKATIEAALGRGQSVVAVRVPDAIAGPVHRLLEHQP